ncbi:MAG: hypothetical protein IJ691_02585 [Lachnospiraceae bacterium]|nr:hypothetical protein [Lachnospiraceae bacterium]
MDNNETNNPYTQTVEVTPQAAQTDNAPQTAPADITPQPVPASELPPEALRTLPLEEARVPEPKSYEKLLCFLSLGLYVFGPTASGIPMYIVESINLQSDVSSPIFSVLSSFGGVTYIAAWVLMIIARVKYKKSVFAKVLMWVYIGLLVAAIIAVIILVATCINALNNCNCSGMG